MPHEIRLQACFSLTNQLCHNLSYPGQNRLWCWCCCCCCPGIRTAVHVSSGRHEQSRHSKPEGLQTLMIHADSRLQREKRSFLPFSTAGKKKKVGRWMLEAIAGMGLVLPRYASRNNPHSSDSMNGEKIGSSGRSTLQQVWAGEWKHSISRGSFHFARDVSSCI